MPPVLKINDVVKQPLSFVIRYSRSKVIPELDLTLPPNVSVQQGDNIHLSLDDYVKYNYSVFPTVALEDVVPTNLTLCFPFNGNLNNVATVSGFTLSASSSDSIEYIDGIHQEAAAFNDASLNALTGPDVSPFLVEDYTIAFWYKTDETTLEQIFRIGSLSSYGIIIEITSGGSIRVREYSDTTHIDMTSTATINDGEWHFVSIVKNDDLRTLYIDNVSDQTGTSTARAGTNAPQSVSHTISNTTWSDDTAIDSFTAYDRALTVAEISALFNYDGSVQRFQRTLEEVDGPITNPVLRYEFEDNLDSTGSNTQTSTNSETPVYSEGRYGQGYGDPEDTTLDTDIDISNLDMDLNDAFTIAFWCKFENASSTFDRVLSASGSGEDWDFRIEDDSGDIVMKFNSGITTEIDCGIVSDEFVHIAITYDGDSLYTIYRNGETVSRIKTSDVLSSNVHIGSSGSNAFRYGVMDELRYYDFGFRHMQVRDLAITNGVAYEETDIIGQDPQILLEDRVDLNFGGIVRKNSELSERNGVVAMGYINELKNKDYGITYYGKGIFEVLSYVLRDVFPDFKYVKDSDIEDRLTTSLTIDGK